MAERKALSKKIRFEVFKRDKFTCQYCGRTAPDVVLEVDHIEPVANGGSDDLMNLITSCKDCNRGKGARELSDDSVVKKQQAQLQELAEKNEQLEMMLKWRDGMLDVREKEIEAISDSFNKNTDGEFFVNDNGRKNISKWLREFSVIEILDAMDIAFDNYYEDTKNSAEYAFNKVPGICYNRKNQTKQNYWFNYLKKSCERRYGKAPMYSSYIRRLKDVCFRHLKDEEDFENVKSLLYSNGAWSYFINSLEEMFV